MDSQIPAGRNGFSSFQQTLWRLQQGPSRKLANALTYIHPHIPFTLAGVSVFALALVALQSFGYRRMDLVVFALSVCVISIILFCLLMVTLAGFFLRRQLAPYLSRTLPLIR